LESGQQTSAVDVFKSKDDQEKAEKTVSVYYEYNEESQQLEPQSRTVTWDYRKYEKELKTERQKIERAQKSMQNYLAQFQSKTL